MIKLSARERDMLERLRREPALAGHWDFSGDLMPRRLAIEGLIKRVDHPTVVDRRRGVPAVAFVLTDAGRAALKERKP